MLTLLAENAALRKANTMKENVGPMISRPEKGSAGNGFNLQAKMGLANDDELYGALRVSHFFFFYTHSYLRNCSVVFEMQSTRLGLTIGSNGTANPSTSLPRSSGWCVVHCQSFINSLSSRSPRLENAMSISSDSHMDGQLKNSSSLASRTSALMHVNGDIYKNLVM
jgi:hypothetical protein